MSVGTAVGLALVALAGVVVCAPGLVRGVMYRIAQRWETPEERAYRIETLNRQRARFTEYAREKAHEHTRRAA